MSADLLGAAHRPWGLVAHMAAVHDLGKACAAFQSRTHLAATAALRDTDDPELAAQLAVARNEARTAITLPAGSGKSYIIAFLGLLGVSKRSARLQTLITGHRTEAPALLLPDHSGRPDFQPRSWRQFGDVRELVNSFVAFEQKLQVESSSTRHAPTAKTGKFGQDRLIAINAKRAHAPVASDGAYRFFVRRSEIHRRRLDHRAVVVCDEQGPGVDHSTESHRSRAPGSQRTSIDLVRWESLVV